MKTKLLILVILCCSFTNIKLGAQVVVSDPTAAIKLGETIDQGYKSLNMLEKTVETLEVARDKIENVSGLLQSIDEIKEIYELQRKSLKYAKDYSKKLTDVKDLTAINTSLGMIESNVIFLNKILTKGFFSMNDYERLQMIQNTRAKVYTHFVKIKKYKYR